MKNEKKKINCKMTKLQNSRDNEKKNSLAWFRKKKRVEFEWIQIFTIKFVDDSNQALNSVK